MKIKLCLSAFVCCLAVIGRAQDGRAKNVILFLGDAGGVPTLNAAGIYAHDRPQSLFIQSMPQIALMDTSSLDAWVTDSAAGMTAIVTGQKTNNGMVSLLPGEDERPLKTILEYAEEHGLATGVVTNMAVWDATPAACYAHAASRKTMAQIFSQVLSPRFGDGVDVLIGADRKKLFTALEATGTEPLAALRKAGYTFVDHPTDIAASSSRVVSIYDGADFSPEPVIDSVLQILSQNKNGFFLMIEWDMHMNNLTKGLDRIMVMDDLIRHVSEHVASDTLILFAADHSFALQLRGGKKNNPLSTQMAAPVEGVVAPKPVILVENGHTGEEVLVTAQGPGSERVHGFIPNTRLFEIMMAAYGWSESR